MQLNHLLLLAGLLIGALAAPFNNEANWSPRELQNHQSPDQTAWREYCRNASSIYAPSTFCKVVEKQGMDPRLVNSFNMTNTTETAGSQAVAPRSVAPFTLPGIVTRETECPHWMAFLKRDWWLCLRDKLGMENGEPEDKESPEQEDSDEDEGEKRDDLAAASNSMMTEDPQSAGALTPSGNSLHSSRTAVTTSTSLDLPVLPGFLEKRDEDSDDSETEEDSKDSEAEEDWNDPGSDIGPWNWEYNCGELGSRSGRRCRWWGDRDNDYGRVMAAQYEVPVAEATEPTPAAATPSSDFIALPDSLEKRQDVHSYEYCCDIDCGLLTRLHRVTCCRACEYLRDSRPTEEARAPILELSVLPGSLGKRNPVENDHSEEKEVSKWSGDWCLTEGINCEGPAPDQVEEPVETTDLESRASADKESVLEKKQVIVQFSELNIDNEDMRLLLDICFLAWHEVDLCHQVIHEWKAPITMDLEPPPYPGKDGSTVEKDPEKEMSMVSYCMTNPHLCIAPSPNPEESPKTAVLDSSDMGDISVLKQYLITKLCAEHPEYPECIEPGSPPSAEESATVAVSDVSDKEDVSVEKRRLTENCDEHPEWSQCIGFSPAESAEQPTEIALLNSSDEEDISVEERLFLCAQYPEHPVCNGSGPSLSAEEPTKVTVSDSSKGNKTIAARHSRNTSAKNTFHMDDECMNFSIGCPWGHEPPDYKCVHHGLECVGNWPRDTVEPQEAADAEVPEKAASIETRSSWNPDDMFMNCMFDCGLPGDKLCRTQCMDGAQEYWDKGQLKDVLIKELTEAPRYIQCADTKCTLLLVLPEPVDAHRI